MICYRPDVDGLRAIAILAVLLFHIDSSILPSGFIGVDIFFVISGYLITSIILGEVQANTFSLKKFYERRILRLLPALLLVLFFVSAFSYFFFLPNEFKNLGRHIFSGAIFISNFTLSGESGYFDSAAEFKPLMHLWSLAIEEQYYLIFPLVLLVFFKISRNVFLLILIALLLSFFCNLLAIEADPSGSFFMPQFRFWEILAGSLVAVLSGQNQRSEDFKLNRLKLQSVYSVVGVILLVLGFLYIDKTKLFPGWWALLPCIGTSLILAGDRQALVNKYLLSNKYLVRVGLISYPLYLWHWPLISFHHIFTHDNALENANGQIKILIIGLAFILAYITYRYIEIPLKRVRMLSKPALALTLLLTLFSLGFAGYKISKGDLFERPLSKDVRAVTDALNDWDSTGKMKKFGTDEAPYYEIGNNDKVLFFGDSHIGQLYPRIEQVIEQYPNSKGAVFVTRGACPPIPNVVKIPPDIACERIRKVGIDKAFDRHVSAIVLGASWLNYFKRKTAYMVDGQYIRPNSIGYEKSLLELKKFLKFLNQTKKKIYVVLTVPVSSAFDPSGMIKRNFSFDPFTVKASKFSQTMFKKEYGSILQDLKNIAESESAEILDPFLFVCDTQECQPLTADGKPIYMDTMHVRPFFVKEKFIFLDKVMLP